MSIISSRVSSIWHDVHLVDYGPISSVKYAINDYLVIDKLLPEQIIGVSVRQIYAWSSLLAKKKVYYVDTMFISALCMIET